MAIILPRFYYFSNFVRVTENPNRQFWNTFVFPNQLAFESEICFTPINNLRRTKGDTKDRKLLSINLSIFKQTKLKSNQSYHLAPHESVSSIRIEFVYLDARSNLNTLLLPDRS